MYKFKKDIGVLSNHRIIPVSMVIEICYWKYMKLLKFHFGTGIKRYIKEKMK